MSDYAKLSDLIGKTMARVENAQNEEIVFTTEAGEVYRLFHDQDCCESVRVEEIVGDLADLVGAPLLLAEEVSSEDRPPVDASDAEYGTFTWTFYRLGTIKGYVTIRFYGTSNGYYSESVSFERVS